MAPPGGGAPPGDSGPGDGGLPIPFPAEFELSSLLLANGGDGSTGVVLNGIDEEDLSGRSVSAAGDVNGDGIDDLIISGDNADADRAIENNLSNPPPGNSLKRSGE